MDSVKKIRHFWGAIKSSFVGLIVSAVLFVACCILFALFPASNNQTIPFLVGIVASVIASTVFNVTSKYAQSCSTYLWMLEQVEVFITYTEATYKSMLGTQQYQFELWKYVVDIREKCRMLTFKADFDILASRLSDVISVANSGNKEDICKALECLIAAKNQITEPKCLR